MDTPQDSSWQQTAPPPGTSSWQHFLGPPWPNGGTKKYELPFQADCRFATSYKRMNHEVRRRRNVRHYLNNTHRKLVRNWHPTLLTSTLQPWRILRCQLYLPSLERHSHCPTTPLPPIPLYDPYAPHPQCGPLLSWMSMTAPCEKWMPLSHWQHGGKSLTLPQGELVA